MKRVLPRTTDVAWLAHDLWFSEWFRCKGGPGNPGDECDGGLPVHRCWRHDRLAARLKRLRARAAA